MNRHYIILFLAFCFHSVNAQVKRSFLYEGTSIEFFAQNNRLQNIFSFPGMKAFIIIGDSSKSLIEIYTSDKLRQLPISGMNDYACFYYLKDTKLLNDTTIKKFLKGFVNQNYESDYIDRNSVNLVWQTNKHRIPNYIFTKPDTIINSKFILNDSDSISDSISDRSYNFSTPEQIWDKSKIYANITSYLVPSLLEMEEGEKLKKINELKEKNSNIYFQFTTGLHYINKNYKTDFDSSMLVDFTNYKTIWNINIGYYFTRHLFTSIDFAFIYTGKHKNINGITRNDNGGITVNGSGYGGAMIRYGVGLGWLPYSNKSLDILLTLAAGQLTAKAGGGTVTRTIGGSGDNNSTATMEKKEQTNYYNLLTGVNYKLNSSFYFTGNIQYNLSKLKQPIGSVSAFTGLSINGGLGFTIPSKKKNN